MQPGDRFFLTGCRKRDPFRDFFFGFLGMKKQQSQGCCAKEI